MMKPKPILLLLVAAAIAAQTQTGPEFEVASIKPSAPYRGGAIHVGCKGGPGSNDPALLTCENMSLSNMVSLAYAVESYRLSAPGWMAGAHFDIDAKIPAGATPDQLGPMWRNLLAQRFGLAIHHEPREMQAYRLVAGKNGSKLKPGVKAVPGEIVQPAGVDADGFPILRTGVPGMSVLQGRAHWYNPNVNMADLTQMLRVQTGGPVTDATGLTGEYEIDLRWVRDNVAMANPDAGQTLQQAVESQLGLRLESTRGIVDFLVVDRADKEPTAN